MSIHNYVYDIYTVYFTEIILVAGKIHAKTNIRAGHSRHYLSQRVNDAKAKRMKQCMEFFLNDSLSGNRTKICRE